MKNINEDKLKNNVIAKPGIGERIEIDKDEYEKKLRKKGAIIIDPEKSSQPLEA